MRQLCSNAHWISPSLKSRRKNVSFILLTLSSSLQIADKTSRTWIKCYDWIVSLKLLENYSRITFSNRIAIILATYTFLVNGLLVLTLRNYSTQPSSRQTEHNGDHSWVYVICTKNSSNVVLKSFGNSTTTFERTRNWICLTWQERL